MDKLSQTDYLGLLKILCNVTTDSSLNKQMKVNIRTLIETLAESQCFKELVMYIDDSMPNLISCIESIDFVTNNELCCLFVEWILIFLEFYNVSLTKAVIYHSRSCKYKTPYGSVDPSPDNLDQKQKQLLRQSVDFVFVLGISPQLVIGIFDSPTHEHPLYQQVLASFRGLPNFHGNLDLLKRSVDVVIGLYESKQSLLFKDHILSIHFRPYLLALFQLCHCPDTVEKVWNKKAKSDNESLKQYLEVLIDQSPKKFIFRELTSLPAIQSQGNDSKNPMWLTEVSGLFIRDCILKEEGVKSFILSFVEGEPQNFVICQDENCQKPTSIDWVKCDLLSRIITDCPLGDMADGLYCSAVLDQIQEMIEQFYFNEKTNHPNPDRVRPLSKSIVPIMVNTMAAFWARHPLIFDKKILQRLAEPIYICTRSNFDSFWNTCAEDEIEIVSEKDFSLCIETLYEILIIFRLPSSKLAKCMLPLVGVLYELYSFTTVSPTYLSSSVESLFLETLLCLESEQAFSLLKFFSELEDFDPALFQRSQAIRFMNKDVHFATGLAGGVRVVLRHEGHVDKSKSAMSSVEGGRE